MPEGLNLRRAADFACKDGRIRTRGGRISFHEVGEHKWRLKSTPPPATPIFKSKNGGGKKRKANTLRTRNGQKRLY